MKFKFDWNRWKGTLTIQGKTIKGWCRENNIDRDRYQNIKAGRTMPTDKEIKLFNSVFEDGEEEKAFII